MFDRSKMIILVTGTTIQPYDKNWKECESTWMPELRKLGYTVKVAIGNPKMNKYVKEVNNIVYFAAEDTKRFTLRLKILKEVFLINLYGFHVDGF